LDEPVKYKNGGNFVTPAGARVITRTGFRVVSVESLKKRLSQTTNLWTE